MKAVPARMALDCIRNGQTLFIGSGCAEPVLLTRTLAEMAEQFSDLRVIHIMAQGDQHLAQPELLNHFRYNTFYIGRGVEAAVAEGTADFTPINMSEVPAAMVRGTVGVDVALIQVSPPDEAGQCSLGISVDIVKAAVMNANIVIALVNENMPVTRGDSLIPMDLIDFRVEGSDPLIEVSPPPLDPLSLTIGRHVADIITDGMTLHFDTGAISAATMRYLDSKHDLGIHTEILTDDLLRLLRTGAVSNLKKGVNRGTSVVTMVHGSRELYEAVDRNPEIEVHPIEYVNDPIVIARNDNMVSLHSVHEVDLTGQARVEMEEASHYRNLPSSTDFLYGTRRSKNGLTLMALPSTTPDGRRSRIVAELKGSGVIFNRAMVDIVVTEYGSVYLHGLSIRERAVALISIAHPRFRKLLLEEAKLCNYVDPNQIIPPESGSLYPHHYEFHHTFSGGLEVFFRPMKPTDVRRIQKLFYSLSLATIRQRYHGAIKILSNESAQKLANVDYSQDMAIIGLVGPRSNQKIIAEGRYMYNPTRNMGEFDILVAEDYRGKGIGIFLADYLKKIAYSRGIAGVYADVIEGNRATMALLAKAWPTTEKHFESDSCIYILRFPREDILRPKDSIIVYSGRFNDYTYGEAHPFKPERARSALRLIDKEGFLSEPWMRVEEPRMTTRERLIESHDPAFIETLERAGAGKWDEALIHYNLGGDDVPVFRGLFDYIMLYTSATLTGVDLITDDKVNLVFNPLGGFHHASRNHAEGFCYVNDAIVAIDDFLAHGFRVAYIDIDAHHGNGVQDTYYKDDRVLVISTHETGKTLYPWSGFETEIGEERGRGFNINIPMPPQTDDEAFEMVLDQILTPAMKFFKPGVVVAVVGADTHRNDPLTHLSLTNNGMVEALKRVRTYSNHLLLLGGGGYNLKSTARAWCRMWATANRIDSMPDYLSVLGGTFLGSEELKGAGIVDPAYRVSGEEKDKIFEALDEVIQFHMDETLPLLKERCGERT